ncbi:MAG: type II toxin-antitoxin system RelE/ParE family toxin [Parachlamydiaceae bacterium]|nr:type II toxin-antitoxin system RelE/ParE family toxin [Parachlamydiaceae bacterium]
MIQSFADDATSDIFNGINSKRARKKIDPVLLTIVHRKFDMLDAAANLNDLKIPPANRLEALKGNLKGKYSIRINDQYRVIFSWGIQGPEQVEIIDYH